MSGVRAPHYPPSSSQFYRGAVVQLVRIPACHAGGRGFESRPLRQLFKKGCSSSILFVSLSSCFEQHRGAVVQLVRIPACHAGGRGFESRPLRQLFRFHPPLSSCMIAFLRAWGVRIKRLSINTTQKHKRPCCNQFMTKPKAGLLTLS